MAWVRAKEETDKFGIYLGADLRELAEGVKERMKEKNPSRLPVMDLLPAEG